LRVVLFFFLLFIFYTGTAQQRLGKFIVYGKENGVGQNAYHDVFESSDGYLWAASNNGIFKFDGKRFKQIITLYNNKNSPTDNNIGDIEEDNEGNLWMAGFTSGVSKYNLKTGKFRQYKRLSQDSTAGYGTTCITKDEEGTVWIGTAGRGLAKYLPAKDTFDFFYPDEKKHKDGSVYGENWVAGCVQDESNKDIFWLSCFDGLYSFNRKSKVFAYYNPGYNSLNQKFSYNTFLCIEQHYNNLYLGTWFEGLVIFDKITKQFKRISYNNPGKLSYQYGILDLQLLGDSVLYLAAMNDGLLAFDVKTEKLSPVIRTSDIKLTNTTINIQRVNNTTHAGFFAGGNSSIYQLSNRQNRFTQYNTYSVPKTAPLEEIGLREIIYDKNKNGYWLALFNAPGLLFYDSSFTHPQNYLLKEKNEWLNDIAQDSNGNIWATSRYGSLYFYNYSNKYSITKINTAANEFLFAKDIFFREVESCAGGNLIWLISNTTAFLYNVNKKTATQFTLPANEIKKHSKKGIIFFAAKTDSKNNLWMATNTGLLQLNATTQKVNYYYGALSSTAPLAGTAYKSITIDKNDNLWLGYFTEGIQVVDTKKKQVQKSYSIYNGLPSMEVNYMACDTSNNILACFHNGLAVYNAAINDWQIINTIDGLKRDYLDLPVFALPNGQIILEQSGEFLHFSSGNIWQKPDSVFTHITSIKVNGEDYQKELLPDYITHISLPHSTKEIQIEFAAMDWKFPFRTKYFYRVDGIHKNAEWIPNEEAMINLAGLAPGNYTFKFYAITNDGVKTAERKLTIQVHPPFYKTWWFILLSILLLAVILFALYKYRINQLKKLHAIRNTISRNLHDDIGASLSNIGILNEMAKRNAGNKDKLNEYLAKAAEDIQQTSENLGDIVWNINPQYDDLKNLFVRMRRYASDMMDGKNIAYTISFPEEIAAVKLNMDKRRNLFLIFKEAVNNLAKYSQAANATIALNIQHNQLYLTIKDDGKGFDKKTIVAGNGLTNMQERANLCGGQLKIISATGAGTSVELIFPV
jgi:ligand-binding sensor domain-containing protein